MKRATLPALVLSALCAPALAHADVPVLDNINRRQDQKRRETTDSIEETDKDQFSIHTSVTCSMFRKGRANDPVSAAEANPEIAGLVRRVAREEGVDENQFLALVYQESRFNPCARSDAGATGLSQLMPGTAAQLGVNENNIEDNLRGGARYYREQLKRNGGNVSLALAAYNAGPGNVSKFGGVPPFKETQGYVASITQKWLPAFSGSDKSGIPVNYGGGDTAYVGMRTATLNAMGTTAATSDSLSDVSSWYQQLGAMQTSTIQDSWDRNSTARNANLEMMNAVIALGTSLSDLINSSDGVLVSSLSGSSRSTTSGQDADRSRDAMTFCDISDGLVWNERNQACVKPIQTGDHVQLTLQAQ